ncbi:MAG TPA: polyribonucleotide nucleotidyltransferase [Candidatus Babeliales bacterium]|jgi:polyribonucleotide nucleotidyltransferase|nr:polyribonucleotide nucleotidyltransferase [Candidatus Babeliales bacterium]
MVRTFKNEEFGFEVEIGKVARQADGSVLFKQGGTVILAAATSAPSKEFPGFLPLTTEYREMYSAAGKIPGGYFKREGKLSDREVLTSRLIDRAIRPLFPYNYFNQLQVITTVYSVDKIHAPNTNSLLAASLALSISKIPFLGPIGVIEIGRVNGKWLFNPTHPEQLASDMRIVVAGTEEGIVMVEGSTNELSEKDFVDVMFQAHEKVKKLIAWQKEIQKALHYQETPVEDIYQFGTWKNEVSVFLTDDRVKRVNVTDKHERYDAIDTLKEEFAAEYQEKIDAAGAPQSVINYILDDELQEKLSAMIFKTNKRVDGRDFTTVRPISVEVGLLPGTHGSALFTRGNTQALATVTLGSGEDEQKIDTLMQENPDEGLFMLHYNFPPFATGEVKPMRGTSRRETGHGYLARSSFEFLRPAPKDFPYTTRVVVDILESDGSSSMATACSTTMALMDAGFPLKKMVAGVAMGLLEKNSGNFQPLTDISGFEDAFGLMDFKVVGTDSGITAIQMDVKYKGGLPRNVFEQALEQARIGRLYILGEMRKVMSAPKAELSPLVPKVITLTIIPDKIGAIIGSGGKTIREITETTGTSIDIEPDGLVKIYGGPEAQIDLAVRWVKTLAGQIEKGAIFNGKVRRIADFGAFVELVPGLDGLVHVSNMPREIQRNFGQTLKVNDEVKVEVLDHDEVTGRTSLKLLS